MIVVELARDARELARVSAGRPSTRALLRAVLLLDSFPVTLLSRLREAARRVPGLSRLLRVVQHAVYGVDIGKDVRLGHGVWFVHPIGTVVGGDARIGDRVRLMGNNTVGTARDDGYPVIDSDVLVGAGARVLGPIHVGAGAVIGANAVVLCDVPAGALAVGVPAQIKERRHGDEADGSDRRRSVGERRRPELPAPGVGQAAPRGAGAPDAAGRSVRGDPRR